VIVIVVEQFMADALVYGSLFALMAIGLTVTYMTTKIPNFAHGSFVTIGVYLAFSMNHFQSVSPYVSIPFSFIIGGLTAMFIYRIVLRPLSNRGSSIVTLMISTLAIDIFFIGVFGIYSDLLSNVFGVYDSKFFLLISSDFEFLSIRGLTFAAPISLAVITFVLWLFLTRTKFGVAMRATVENPGLAGVLGINTDRVYAISWFLAGGLAAVAGSYVVLWLPGNPHIGSDFIVGIFAASVLGGLFSVYGAVLGGLLVGAGEIIITVYGSRLLGSWFTQYQVGIPMVILAFSLLVVPQGLTSINLRRLAMRKKRK